MKCQRCGGESEVLETRQRVNANYRRRKCTACGYRWSTIEAVVRRRDPDGAGPQERPIASLLDGRRKRVPSAKKRDPWAGVRRALGLED